MITYEITIKNILDVEKVANKIQEKGIKSISLTNKVKDIDNLFVVKNLIKLLKGQVKIQTVYSIRVNGTKSKNYAIQVWDDYLRRSISHNHKNILVVSGVPKMKNFSSVDALNYAVKYKEFGLNLSVAFNPFEEDFETEVEHLKNKVSTGMVSGIFFQLGDNYLLLKKGLAFCKKNFPDIPRFVSVLYPTDQLLHILKIRPWRGVKFSNTFLSDPTKAAKINDQIIRIAEKNSANIYISGYV